MFSMLFVKYENLLEISKKQGYNHNKKITRKIGANMKEKNSPSMISKKGSIGVFDSGIGGVTVLREILKILPNENYIYYSDSKNNPYGDKTDEEIFEICDDIVQKLLEKNCKVIVIACNTASAKAVSYLRKKYLRNIICCN